VSRVSEVSLPWPGPAGAHPDEDDPRFRRDSRKEMLAVFSVPAYLQYGRAACGLTSHPAVLGPPSKNLGHAALAPTDQTMPGRPRLFRGSAARSTEDSPDGGEHF
jgi:hypothetical protein